MSPYSHPLYVFAVHAVNDDEDTGEPAELFQNADVHVDEVSREFLFACLAWSFVHTTSTELP